MNWGLSAGFLLDRQWHWLRGELETTKRPVLQTFGRFLNESRIPHAIIRGIAVQVHHPEPRTTLDIDLAVLSRQDIPREALMRAGFRVTGSFEHSENWIAADGTPVQSCGRIPEFMYYSHQSETLFIRFLPPDRLVV